MKKARTGVVDASGIVHTATRLCVSFDGLPVDFTACKTRLTGAARATEPVNCVPCLAAVK